MFEAAEGQLPPPGGDAFDGYIITGSRHGVYEEVPWIQQLCGWVAEAHAEKSEDPRSVFRTPGERPLHASTKWLYSDREGGSLRLIPVTLSHDGVRSFSTHEQLSSAQGSSTTVSRSDIQLIQHFDYSAHGLVRRWLLTGAVSLSTY